MSRKLACLSLGLAGLCAACVANTDNLQIIQNQLPVTGAGAMGCSVPAMRTETTLSFGVLDVAFDDPYPYLMFPLLQNNYPKSPTSSSTAMPTDPNEIYISGARMTVHPKKGVLPVTFGKDCPLEHFFPVVATVDPGAQYALIIEVIRSCHSKVIKDAFEQGSYPSDPRSEVFYTVDVTIEGTRSGAKETSQVYTYPVQVCYACLQKGFTDPAYVKYDYPNTPSCVALGGNDYPGNPCNPAQDTGPVLCCRDEKGALECPARGRSSAGKP
jgi:hypothetical protein